MNCSSLFQSAMLLADKKHCINMNPSFQMYDQLGRGRSKVHKAYIHCGRFETYESVQGEIGHYIREDTYVSK